MAGDGMSWHRDLNGLWCACFQAYQPDSGGGCPANPCPENTRFLGLRGATCVCGCRHEHPANCPHGCTIPEPDDGTPSNCGSVKTEPYEGIYAKGYKP